MQNCHHERNRVSITAGLHPQGIAGPFQNTGRKPLQNHPLRRVQKPQELPWAIWTGEVQRNHKQVRVVCGQSRDQIGGVVPLVRLSICAVEREDDQVCCVQVAILRHCLQMSLCIFEVFSHDLRQCLQRAVGQIWAEELLELAAAKGSQWSWNASREVTLPNTS